MVLILHGNKLYINLKKCIFLTGSNICLGFVVGADGVWVDDKKVRAIWEWPVPMIVLEVWDFLGLETFNCRFICHFSTIMDPITKFTKKEKFHCSKE